MIELFYSSSPNVLKVIICLEEMDLPYEVRFVDLSKGEQFDPDKIAGSLTAKVPVIRDHTAADGGPALTVFESGAILTYLAEKTGLLIPDVPRQKLETLQWLTWQMANLGPIGGQFWHFERFAERLEPGTDFTYPQRRYRRMMDSIWDLMERRMQQVPYIAGAYSIADVACFPWVHYLDFDPASRPALARWHDKIFARPAVDKAYARSLAVQTGYGRNDRQGIAYPFEGLAKHTLLC